MALVTCFNYIFICVFPCLVPGSLPDPAVPGGRCMVTVTTFNHLCELRGRVLELLLVPSEAGTQGSQGID